MRKYIYEEAVSHIWLSNRSRLNFLIYEENLIFLSMYGLASLVNSSWNLSNIPEFNNPLFLILPRLLCWPQLFIAWPWTCTLKSVYFSMYVPPSHVFICVIACCCRPRLPPFLLPQCHWGCPFLPTLLFSSCPRYLSCYFGLQVKQLQAMPDLPTETRMHVLLLFSWGEPFIFFPFI